MANLRCKACLCILYWVTVFVSAGFCFNLDTTFPLVFSSPGATTEDYFGFSVGLLLSSNRSKALITAPKANSTEGRGDLHQPGALFSCDIPNSGNTTRCEEVVMFKNWERNENLNDMWFGVSSDIHQSHGSSEVVVCGHLMKLERQTRNDARYDALGSCYLINGDLSPTSVKQLPINQRYSHGQWGASVAFSEDGKYVFLGGPGYYTRNGALSTYESATIQGSWVEVQRFDIGSRSTNDLYMGYSVTTGTFFGTSMYAAVGAPRDADFKGTVYIVRTVRRQSAMSQKIVGFQFGEYFGASVSGIDLNADGLTDLLVGAPLFSRDSGGDEGKVYVYFGQQNTYLAEPTELVGSNKPDARFGTSIGSPGDLNQDGFNDVVIGAPYEDGTGAVYIYHGSRDGLSTTYVQRIAAADFKDTVHSGFGISLSRGLDIDNNSYPDLLIGSYDSSNAVLLRTYPVIHVSSTIEFQPPMIGRNMISLCNCGGEALGCFNVTYHLKYYGKHAPASLEFKTILIIDTRGQRQAGALRGFIRCNGRQQQIILNRVQLNNGYIGSFQETAYIMKNIKDEVTPFKFHLSYELDRNSMNICQHDSFSKRCPVIDPKYYTYNTKEIHFLKECGADQVCWADLKVTAVIPGYTAGTPLMIGEHKTLTVDVVVQNLGEPAYGTELSIRLPSKTPLVKYDKMCEPGNAEQEQVDNATLLCTLGTLNENKKVNLQLQIDIESLPPTTETEKLQLEASSISKENNTDDNKRLLSIAFVAAADIDITGKPEDEQILFVGQKDTLLVKHNYYVRYYGPSPVPTITIKLSVPSLISGKTVVKSIDAEADSNEVTTTCVSTSNLWNDKSRGQRGSVNVSIEDKREDISAHDDGKSEVNTETGSSGEDKTVSTAKRGGDYTVDCERAGCEIVRCTAGPFLDGQKSTKITLSTELDIAALGDAVDDWSTIKFLTGGQFNVLGVKKLSEKYREQTTVETEILRPAAPAPTKIENWIIFVSIAIGLLLLLIILIALIKIGFFKRKQREQMKAMMHEANVATEMQQPAENSGAEGTTEGAELRKSF